MDMMSFAVDEEVDVLDPVDDIWSPARIKTGNWIRFFYNTYSISVLYKLCNYIWLVGKDGSYEVTFTGWGEEFDETVDGSSGRLAPEGSHVVRAKAWVRLHPSLCLWPCLLFIRTAEGESGKENLRAERKVPNEYYFCSVKYTQLCAL